MIRYCLFTFIGFLLLTAGAQAQVVKGKIIDAQTGKAIPNASIYLNGTSTGTTSNNEGQFTLHTSETTIPLVVSCVGYESQSINNYTNANLSIALSPRTMTLKEVVIGNNNREELIKTFLTEFIGSTSKDCTISNLDDVNFTWHKKTKSLEADASEPLLIYNKKLGYKITYFLSTFKHTPNETYYYGNYFFAEDTSGLKPRAVKKILSSRDDAYFGSRMHFIRSLWVNDLEYNNYDISDKNSVKNAVQEALKSSYNKKTHDKDFYNYLVRSHGNQKFISPVDTVLIKYYRDASYIVLNHGAKETVIESNGYYGSDIVWSGEMAYQRLNLLLPFEFEPSRPLSVITKEKQEAQVVTNPALARMIIQQDSFLKYHNPEKLYLQTDKPYYTTGDTLRFKAYLLNADYLTPSNRTGLLYVELNDPAGKAAKRIMVPVTTGLAWGDIALDEKELPTGNYTLRAYTNWIRNFGEDYIYKQNITISAIADNTLLVKANFAQQNNKVEGTMQFTSLDGHVQILKDMELRVMNGKKNLSKDKLTTGVDGALKVNFDLPVTAAGYKDNFFIIAKDVTKGTTNGAELTIPVTLNRLQNTDIQFMPEGGSLVAGIKTKVGFKAIGEDGKGAAITGRITDSKQKEIAAIKATHAGMGSFEFKPKAGETYAATINGIAKTFALPAVNPAGTSLSIKDNIDSLLITVTQTDNNPDKLYYTNTTYYLIGRSRGVLCYAQVINFTNTEPIKKAAAKDVFPTGIAQFTLLNIDRLPVNERQVFIDHHDNLQFSVAVNKPNYGIRDSLALAITVKDKYGRPVQGDFSLAVTEDNQVKTDSLSSNLRNNLLLTSDLKGNIEEPGYYFADDTKQKQTDLDNLMLTQGWIGYDWAAILKPITPLAYQPEKEFKVTGKVVNAFNKPIENSGVVMFIKIPLTVKDTLTDEKGRFTFKGIFPIDSTVINLQARNKRGKEFNVGIIPDEFNAPEFSPVNASPWYVNGDSIILNNSKIKAAQFKTAADYRGEGRMLKEVQIKDKKIINGSKNLNSPGEADEVVDEKTMNDAKHVTLNEFLSNRYKAFFTKEIRPRGYIMYHLYRHTVHLVIDGVMIEKYGLSVADYMDYLTAEDIKGIEIINTSKYITTYIPNYSEIVAFLPDIYVPIILEITTYSGNGAFYKKTPGIALYRPLFFTLPKQFYSPKYTVKNKTIAMGTDMRSTLHWEPNVLTDADGKATVSFFTADKPANYTVTMEGITGESEIGHLRQKIKPLITNAALK